jgi:LacI family transcriptional regulator
MPASETVGSGQKLRRIALLVETSTSWGSLIIAGVSDYVRRHRTAANTRDGQRWTLYLDARGYFEKPELPAWWSGDGVIARVTTPGLVEQVRALRLPCVNVSQVSVPGAAVQQVTSNQTQIGRLAAETLIRTGVRKVGYVGPPRRDFYTDEIHRSFRATLADAGLPPPLVFDPERDATPGTGPRDLLRPLAEWLVQLGRPAAVLTWGFLGGQRVCEACCFAGLAVPRDISVLSGDYDQLVSDVCDPPLTCIDQAPRQVGYLAAAELDRLLSGGALESPRLVHPAGVIWRQSVVTERVDDRLVSEALLYIQARLARGFDIDALCDHLGVSRRKLELRFRQTVGHGPITYLRRQRLQEGCRLLAETSLLVKQIALKCGFHASEQFQRLLKAETGLTPGQYREAHRRPPRGAAAPELHDFKDDLAS